MSRNYFNDLLMFYEITCDFGNTLVDEMKWMLKFENNS